MSNNPHDIFAEFLEKNDGRYTKTKRLIAEEIFNLSDHFEVDSFIQHVKAKTNSISRATMYRTIKQLLDAGLLQKISTREGKVFYEQSRPKNEHAHIICNSCGKIFEMHDNVLQQHIEKYCKNMKFTLDYQSIHIYGECHNCSYLKK